ncbi:hypothetical protein [Nonomuraea sp. NPDC050202]|uniref:hypothetical protein n=1 Tax=Nonomuraea sp. NPDC050202 TaxID=3155035 RepID=UPI0033EC7F76
MSDPNAAEELREVIREAHGLLKDLRAERRAIEQLLDGIPAKVDDRITTALEAGLKDLTEATGKAIDKATANVFHRFETLEAILTGTDRASQRAGRPPLEDLLRNHPHAKGPGRA